MTRACGLLLVLAASLRAAAEPPEIEIKGTHANDAFRRDAASAIRHAYPVYCELGGLTPPEEKAYVLNIYRTREEYLKADQDLNQGKFANNGGFYSVDTGEAHILLTPRSEAAYADRVPLTERMRCLLVHEGSHVFWRRNVPWYEGAPHWVLEGMAEYCAERELGSSAENSSIYFSTGMHTLRRAADAGRLLPIEDILVMDLSGNSDAFTRDLFYREAWGLVKWLVEAKPEAWAQLVKGFEGVAAHEIPAAHGRTLFKNMVGPPREMQKEWVEWIRKFRGGPWETKFGDWRMDGAELEGTAYPKTGSAVLNELELKGDATITAEVWIQDLANGQADVILGGWDDRARNFVKVAFVRSGLVSILILKEDVWIKAASIQTTPAAVPAEKWRTVRISIEGRTIKVGTAKQDLLAYEVKDEDVRLDGRWGFGNFDSSVRFRNWKVETK